MFVPIITKVDAVHAPCYVLNPHQFLQEHDILWHLNFEYQIVYVGHAVVQWLRHCSTNWKVAGSISDGVNGIFHRHNHSGRTIALGSTQPLTETSTRNISWG
jgi:hypothetical protein